MDTTHIPYGHAPNSKDILTKIGAIINEIREGRDLQPVEISRETRFAEDYLDLDSLDVAGIIVELEAYTGHDPFAEAFIDFQAAGQLADLYARS